MDDDTSACSMRSRCLLGKNYINTVSYQAAVTLPRCNLICTGKSVFAVYYNNFSHVSELAFGIWRRESSILQLDWLMYILLHYSFYINH